MVALTNGFPERESGRYTFTDTSHDTVAQFIEWAYRGNCTDLTLTPVEEPLQSRQSKSLSESFSHSEPADNKNEDKPNIQAHTLLCHLRVYIFSDVYLVSGLKKLAFDRFTAILADMGKPKNIDEQLAVIDCLSLAFSSIPLHDELPGWLAHYAAWCVDKLRLQGKFHDLLQSLPALSSRMMETLIPAHDAPWNTKSRNYRVPSYDTRAEFQY